MKIKSENRKGLPYLLFLLFVNAVRNGRGIYHPSQERGHAVEVISSNALIFKEIGIVMMQFLKKMLRVSLTRYYHKQILHKNLFLIDVNIRVSFE